MLGSVPSASASLKQIVRSTCSSIPQVSGFTLDTLGSRQKKGRRAPGEGAYPSNPRSTALLEPVARAMGEEPEHPVGAKAWAAGLVRQLRLQQAELGGERRVPIQEHPGDA
jgi:hypothetical protein